MSTQKETADVKSAEAKPATTGSGKPAVAKKPAAPKTDGFKTVDQGNPKHVSTGKISAQSGLLQFKNAKGKVYTGYAQEYLTDINSHSLKAKKGDVIFFTPDNVTISGVKSFKEL